MGFERVAALFSACLLFSSVLIDQSAAQSLSCSPAFQYQSSNSALHSSALPDATRSLVLLESGNALTLGQVTLGGISTINSYSKTSEDRVSVAFAAQKMYLGVASDESIAGDEFLTDPEKSEIKAYSILNGQELSFNAIDDSVETNLPNRSSYPFHGSVASSFALTDWTESLCSTGGDRQSQNGRVIGALGDKVVSANNAEFTRDFCDPPICIKAINPDFPEQPLIPVGVNPYECMPIPLVDDEGEYVRSAACGECNINCVEVLDDEGEPLLDDEGNPVLECECPICFTGHRYKKEEAWWRGVNPAARIYNSPHNASTIAFNFDAQIEEITTKKVALKKIRKVHGDITGDRLYVGAELAYSEVGLPASTGGVLIYSANGAFQRSYSLFLPGSNFGSVIQSLGNDPEGNPIVAMGGPGQGVDVLGILAGLDPNVFDPAAGVVFFTSLQGSTEYETQIASGLVAGEGYGSSIAPLGDLDGDGYPEAAVGAPGGKYVSIYSFGLGEELTRLSSEQEGFGRSVSVVTSADTNEPMLLVSSESSVSAYRLSSCDFGVEPICTDPDGCGDDFQEDIDEVIEEAEDLASGDFDPEALPAEIDELLAAIDALIAELFSGSAAQIGLIEVLGGEQTEVLSAVSVQSLLNYKESLSALKKKASRLSKRKSKFEKRIGKLGKNRKLSKADRKQQRKDLRRKVRKTNKGLKKQVKKASTVATQLKSDLNAF